MVFKLMNDEKSNRTVWEWCKYVWYSNYGSGNNCYIIVWEWCKYVWYSNILFLNTEFMMFENDVNMYGIQTHRYNSTTRSSLRMM